MLTAVRAASTIGPAIVEIVDPQDAALAQNLGNLATGIEAGIPAKPGAII